MRLTTRVMERLTGAAELDPATDGEQMQDASRDYWRTSTDTYLGSGDYYDRKARILDDLLATLPRCAGLVRDRMPTRRASAADRLPVAAR